MRLDKSKLVNYIADNAELRDRPVLDGGLHGGDDTQRVKSGFALPLGRRAVPTGTGLSHILQMHLKNSFLILEGPADDCCVCGHDVQLSVLGSTVGQVREEAGFDAVRQLSLLLWATQLLFAKLPMGKTKYDGKKPIVKDLMHILGAIFEIPRWFLHRMRAAIRHALL